MSKTRRPSAVANFQTDLPEPEQVKKTVAAVSGQPADTKQKTGRPEKEIKKVPLTTSIRPEYKKKLRLAAVEKGVRPADILDEILTKHFSK